MKTRNLVLFIVSSFFLAALSVGSAFGQDPGGGFVITLKNGSAIRGRTLSRDEKSGKLMLTMTESSGSEPRSYAVIAMDDADSIKASTSDSDSIRIRIRGGSELKCREFSPSPDKVTVKLGSRSSVDVPWDQIDSISFAQ